MILAFIQNIGLKELLLFCCVFLPTYPVPTVIAVIRKHPKIVPIVLINFLAGWTCIGWVVALAWSLSKFEKQDAPK